MYKYIYSIIFTFILINPTTYSSNISINKTDKKIGRNIIDFFKNKNHLPSNYNLNQIIKLSKNSHTFKELHNPFKNYFKIITGKKFSKIYNACNKAIKLPRNTDFILNKINYLSVNKCKQKALRQYKIPKAKKFITDNLASLLKYGYDEEIDDLIDNYKNEDNEMFAKLSKNVEKVLTSSQTDNIDKELWKYVSHNNENTLLFNNAYKQSKSDELFFQKKFNHLFRDIKNNIKNSNFSDIKKQNKDMLQFYDLNKKYLQEKDLLKKIMYLSKTLIEKKEYKICTDLLKKSESMISQKSDILFYLLIVNISQSKYQKALDTVEEYHLIENFANNSTKLNFWIANTFELNNETTMAKYLYKQVFKNDPVSYYGVVSLYRIEHMEKNSASKYFSEIFKDKNSINLSSNIKMNKKMIKELKKLKLWANLSHFIYTKKQVKKILTQKPEIFLKISSNGSNDQNLLQSKIYDEIVTTLINENDYLSVFYLTFNKMKNISSSLDKKLLQRLFPMIYFKHVQNYAGEINPFLVQSLIRQESAFNPNAISRVGARGLMQLMPKTAKSINKRVRVKSLKIPKQNIKLGTNYLSKLINRYDGNLIYSLAAYNAGPTNVNRWIKNIFKGQEAQRLLTVELIPYDETNKYVKLIVRNLFFYEALAKKLKFNPEIREIKSLAVN